MLFLTNLPPLLTLKFQSFKADLKNMVCIKRSFFLALTIKNSSKYAA